MAMIYQFAEVLRHRSLALSAQFTPETNAATI